MNRQAIAGVTPNQTQERTVMIVWPSIAANGFGRFLGGLFGIRLGVYIFTLGNLFALITIPFTAVMCLSKVFPFIGTRYRLTNRRILVERGLKGVLERGVDLHRFNEIDIVVRPGQAWFEAGDLIFRQGPTETFRLPGVSRPEAFRQTCLKSQRAYTSIQSATRVAAATA